MEDSSGNVVGGCHPGADGVRSADDDAACWQHAVRLRREHPDWVVIWIASIRRYRAYPLSWSRHDAGLTAETPDDLATQISRAEQASSARDHTRAPRKEADRNGGSDRAT